MKRLFIALLALVALSCAAQPADVDIVYSGAVPRIVVWDAVTVDADGNPILPTDVVRYEVFYSPSPFIEGQEVSLGIVEMLEATVDISALDRGYYYIGVRSIGETEEGVVDYSSIAWSNTTMATDPTQRFAYLVAGILSPASPTGLRTVP